MNYLEQFIILIYIITLSSLGYILKIYKNSETDVLYNI